MPRNLHRSLLAYALCASIAAVPVAPAFAQSGASTWSLEEYQSLSAEMEAADEDRLLAMQGTDGWRQATLSAIDARRAIIGYISASVRNGSMPADFVAPAAAARLLLIQNIVFLQTELGNCSQAADAVRLLDDAAGSDNAEVERARVVALESVELCEPADDAVVVAPPVEEPVEVTPAPPEEVAPVEVAATSDVEERNDLAEAPPERRGRGQRIAGITMLGVGVGMAVGGLAMDAANAAGPRADFAEERDLCPDCDTARLDELAGDIDAAKVPIGVLIFGGAAVAATGTVVWLTAPSGRNEVAIAPSVAPGFAGVQLRLAARR